MSLLTLKNIGKIYVSEGNVSVGIRGVNLSLDRGEFVAVTGKSGSGKSTLLNVLSGMDTYEEGELYINGEPTSHYMQSDWEEYRKKYISFIFQDYNIIESFTVLQNVELALMNIESPKERRRKALELLRRVGLDKHIHHKGSKLSGGQKQRTVIARALAKDSPIILADEPTGNLDSKTSKEIIELLREVSKEKLVVVVTHNFDQVEEYATRHIRIFDGAVESDHMISDESIISDPESSLRDRENLKYKRNASVRPEKTATHTLRNGLILGRVRFAAMPKLSFFLCVLMTLTALVITMVSSISYEALELFEDTYMFTHIDGRTVIARIDGAPISEDELAELSNKIGAKTVMHYDFMLDRETTYMSLGDDFYHFGFGYPANSVEPDVGRLPEKDNEVLMHVPISLKTFFGEGQFEEQKIRLFDCAIYTVTGVSYYYDNTVTPRLLFTDEGYRTASAIAYFGDYSHGFTINVTVEAGEASDTAYESATNAIVDFDLAEKSYCINTNNYRDAVENFKKYYPGEEIKTTVSVSGEFYDYEFDDHYYGSVVPMGGDVIIESKPMYGTTSKVEMTFDQYTQVLEPTEEIISASSLYGSPEYRIFVSPDIICDFIYDNYFAKSYTQASLFFENDAEAHSKISELRELGYVAVPSDTEREQDVFEVLVNTIALAFVAFSWIISVAFAVIFLALCSSKAMGATKGDVAIMRSMGIPTKVIKVSIYVQTLIALIPAYILTAVTCFIVYTTPKTNAMFPFIHAPGYIIIALSLLAIAVGLSRKYAKKMFSESVKKTLRGGKKAE